MFFHGKSVTNENAQDLGHRVDAEITNRMHYSKVRVLARGPVLHRFSFVVFRSVQIIVFLLYMTKVA